MSQPVIRIKRLAADAPLPTRANEADSGLDLTVCDPVILHPGRPVKIPHRIAVELPPGTEGQIRPRSSTLMRHGLHVALGTIDQGYRGEIATAAINLGDKPVELQPGDRISQLVVCPVILCDVAEVEAVGISDRGANGWGSSDATA